MTSDEIDEAIMDLTPEEQDDLLTEAIDACADEANFWRMNEYKRKIAIKCMRRTIYRTEYQNGNAQSNNS